MAVQQFLTRLLGITRKVTPVVASAGAADGGKIAALDEATGRFHLSLMPDGVAAEVLVLPTSENLTVSAPLVNVYDNGGTMTARKADASNGRRCRGYTKANVTSPANATIYEEGSITGLSGLTPGARYYLSASTPGALTDTPVTSPAGTSIDQYIGWALSATELVFEPEDEIVN